MILLRFLIYQDTILPEMKKNVSVSEQVNHGVFLVDPGLLNVTATLSFSISKASSSPVLDGSNTSLYSMYLHKQRVKIRNLEDSLRSFKEFLNREHEFLTPSSPYHLPGGQIMPDYGRICPQATALAVQLSNRFCKLHSAHLCLQLLG